MNGYEYEVKFVYELVNVNVVVWIEEHNVLKAIEAAESIAAGQIGSLEPYDEVVATLTGMIPR
jgi:hypothetical protein